MDGWITGFIEQGGAAAVALLMLLENVFPPIPSELIMPLAGYYAAQGGMSLWLVILAGTAGSVAGAYFWYWIGRAFNKQRMKAFASRHGRWITMKPQDIELADSWFDRYGHWAVLFGRLVPVVRTLISVPAGASGMRRLDFFVFTVIGSAIWTGLLAIGGYMVGDAFAEFEIYVGYLSNAVVLLLVLVYLYRVATFKGSSGSEAA